MQLIRKAILLAICLCMLLTGCSVWMNGSYISVTPHYASGENQTDGTVVVSSYQQMCDALAKMVEDGLQKSVFYITGMLDSQMAYSVDSAINYVCQTNPIGAYAVNKISYDIGTSMGKTAVALDVIYNHHRSEILRIKQVQDMAGVLSLIQQSLENCENSIVLKVKKYTERDLIQFVQDYVNQNPQKCMEMPQVSISYYPDVGQERVIEIIYSYQTSRETLKNMQRSVGDVFKSAQYYVDPGTEEDAKYFQLYSFLMERYDDYIFETSITPSYSLLRHGVGDSKAFATVYAAMCRQVGLNCQVVSGTKAGVAWHWNVIKMDEMYYHIDLLQCSENGEYTQKLADEMSGYVWDYSAF